MSFFQEPPRLGNQYDDDALLRSYLARRLPEEMRRELEGEWRELGELAGGALYEFQLQLHLCPLAMTDGAARTLLALGHPELIS